MTDAGISWQVFTLSMNTATVDFSFLMPSTIFHVSTVIDVDTLINTVTFVTRKAGTGVATRSVAAHGLLVAFHVTILQALIDVKVAIVVGPSRSTRTTVATNTHICASGTVLTRTDPIFSGSAVINIGATTIVTLKWVTIKPVLAIAFVRSLRVGANSITTTLVLAQDTLVFVHVTVLANPAFVALARVVVNALIRAEPMVGTSTKASVFMFAVVNVNTFHAVACVPFVARAAVPKRHRLTIVSNARRLIDGVLIVAGGKRGALNNHCFSGIALVDVHVTVVISPPFFTLAVVVIGSQFPTGAVCAWVILRDISTIVDIGTARFRRKTSRIRSSVGTGLGDVCEIGLRQFSNEAG